MFQFHFIWINNQALSSDAGSVTVYDSLVIDADFVNYISLAGKSEIGAVDSFGD